MVYLVIYAVLLIQIVINVILILVHPVIMDTSYKLVNANYVQLNLIIVPLVIIHSVMNVNQVSISILQIVDLV